MQGKAPKEIHAILTEILACLPPRRTKDLSAPCNILKNTVMCLVLRVSAEIRHLWRLNNSISTSLYYDTLQH